MRMTKIICTLGPAVDDEEIIAKLIKAGMSVARLNFSHGTHADHLVRVNRLKKVREELGIPVPLLLDTKGPEIRLGKFENNEINLVEGETFTFKNEDIIGNQEMVSISHKKLYEDVNYGTRILINDGLVALQVVKVENKDIICKVLNGGVISNNKGVNIPDTDTHLPSLADQDINDIKFAVENDFDFIAASFVRKEKDVIEIKKLLKQFGGETIKVIAKIENREGVNNFDQILKIADGIMVARGDLGVEIPISEVPTVQKNIIEKCYQAGKPVITATQMLESMIKNPRPTRAEVNDIANAVFEGTSATMLSGESAAGKYPIESVLTMVNVCETCESSIDYIKLLKKYDCEINGSITNAISHGSCTTAADLKAAAIITYTKSGQTARMISRFRPHCPIIALTPDKQTQRQLYLSWGVTPLYVDKFLSIEEMIKVGIEQSLSLGITKEGDLVVMTAGTFGRGSTNLLTIHTVGNALVKGQGFPNGLKGEFNGELCVAENIDELSKNFSDGDVIVMPYTTNQMISYLQKASAIIVEEEAADCHAYTAGVLLGIPVITGAENATSILKNRMVVEIDFSTGTVYNPQ